MPHPVLQITRENTGQSGFDRATLTENCRVTATNVMAAAGLQEESVKTTAVLVETY
jgi:hypothetical protein